MGFMTRNIEFTDYFAIETTVGTEIVPADVVGDNPDLAKLRMYVEGHPDPEQQLQVQRGWLARMSAPGYLDCTEWSAHASREEAEAYLADFDGDALDG